MHHQQAHLFNNENDAFQNCISMEKIQMQKYIHWIVYDCLVYTRDNASFSITSNLPVWNRVQTEINWADKTKKCFSWDVVTATKVVVWYVRRIVSPNCNVLRWAIFFFFPLNHNAGRRVGYYVNGKEICSRSTFPFTTYHTFFKFLILIFAKIV